MRLSQYINDFDQDVRAKYRPVSELGRGAYGLVIRCAEIVTGQHVACKAVDVAALLQTRDGPNIISRLRNEISVMSYLNGHPNIVALKDVCESDRHIFLVQELCTGGTLKDAFDGMAPVGEARVAGIFRGIVKAVLHCHQVRARVRARSHYYILHACIRHECSRVNEK